MDEEILCRVLTGPTASGKTELSLQIAERLQLEIVCMDSMQIYRRMDIGTAKPTPAERSRAPHHLLDICEPIETFSVSEYRDRAEQLIRDKWQQEHKQLLFVGGTGLYLSALLHPMAMGSVPADEGLRAELHARADEIGGKEALHAELAVLDPPTAARLPVNDVRRVIRAIEVTRVTGIPFSKQPSRELPNPFRWKVASTFLPRDILYERINSRVDRMLEMGLTQEVRDLLSSGVPTDAQSMQGLGYKEMIPYLQGQCSLEDAAYAIRLGSRHYAKRQETFLKREPSVHYVDVHTTDACGRLLSFFA